MIKAVIFDVDNVLVDMDEAHFKALNTALVEMGYPPAGWGFHLKYLKGKPTKKKLNVLTPLYDIEPSHVDKISQLKQKYTVPAIEEIKVDQSKVSIAKYLKDRGIKMAACSNAISVSTRGMVRQVGILPYLEFDLSNEDVLNPKPDPEIYLRAMNMLGVKPEETLIVEDSKAGKEAAVRSGAWLCAVKGCEEVTVERIVAEINSIGKIHVVIPMAGRGTRFAERGYSFPKPLIDVHGKPMIQWVIDSLSLDGQYTFVVQKEEHDKYALDDLLELLAPGCFIEQLNGVTEGALCSVLAAENYFNNPDELVMANSDQYVSPGVVEDFVAAMRAKRADAGILTFTATHPKWSFAKLDESGRVVEVAEKRPISNIATVGIYYWKNARDFIKYSHQMINKNIRVNNEFYVCPVFNQAIEDGKNVYTHHISQFWGLGTPEDLEVFLKEVSPSSVGD